MKYAGKYDDSMNELLGIYPEANVIEGDCSRLKKFIKKCKRGEDISLVCIGGSVTRGESASCQDNAYHSLLGNWIASRYAVKVEAFNAGSNGTGSVIGVERVERDVLRHNPDLVIVEFSVNDGDNMLDKEAYESLILRLLNSNSMPAVIHFAMCGRDLKCSRRIHEEICRHYNIPLVSIHPFVARTDDMSIYYKDGVHPLDKGFEIIAALLEMKLCDVEANLALIPDTVCPLPEKITNAGMQDCRATDVKDLPDIDFGSWKIENYNTICDTAGGAPLVITTDCSYILIKYEQSDKHNAEIRIVVDNDESTAKTIKNHGFYYNIVESFCMITEPGKHTVSITMTRGDKFMLSTAYLANFA